MNQPDQLPLEFPTYDHYTVEVRSGPTHQETTLRTFEATSVEEAEDVIEAQREYYAQRDEVQWEGDEVDAQGRLYGLKSQPGGAQAWLITVVPPLSTPLG